MQLQLFSSSALLTVKKLVLPYVSTVSNISRLSNDHSITINHQRQNS